MPTMTRISCPGFAILKDGDRYGLITDMEAHMGLMPVGGALHADARGIAKIMQEFGAPTNSFEQAAALRFAVPTSQVPNVVDWFQTRTNRDTSMSRVLRNALFEETGILTRSQAASMKDRFVGYARGTGTTFRDVRERRTLYLIELYTIEVPSAVMLRLRQQAIARRSHFRFVTADEIRSRKVEINDAPIHPIAASLLNPSKTITRG
jgi:hypothetical protein